MLAATALAAAMIAGGAGASERIERRALLMGTTLDVRVEADTRDAALAASERVLAAVAAAESRLSTWSEDSELARLLAAPTGSEVTISAELADDLDAADLCRSLTGGGFDAEVGALVAAWGLRDGGRRPSERELRTALATMAEEAVRWSRHGDRAVATRRSPAVRLDEGGFGKGSALDDALASLADEPRVSAAELDFGGQLAVYRRPGATPTSHQVVHVAHPDERSRIVARFSISGGSVATTGNGERGLVVDGERLGHVLDPRTGRPAADFGSLTVWVDPARLDDAATFADCLSTGLYVLGPDAALARAETIAGVEVLVAERVPGADEIRVRATAGLVNLVSDQSFVSDAESPVDPAPTTAGR